MPQDSEATAPRPALPMRLTRLRVKNFRSIADIDIPLSPLTVLVGPNGSGKSNVVDALRFVRDVFARGLDQAVMDREGMGVIQRWGTKEIEIGIVIALAGLEEETYEDKIISRSEPAVQISYSFSFSAAANYGLIIRGESVSIDVEGELVMTIINSEELITVIHGETELIREVGIQSIKHPTNRSIQGPEGLFDDVESLLFDEEEWSENYEQDNGSSWRRIGIAATRLEPVVQSFLFYTLNSADLRQPQQMLKEVPFDEKGRNMAASLRRLKINKTNSWNTMCFALQQMVEGFDDISIESVGGYLATKLVYQTSTPHLRTSYIGQESDGTIRIMGILVALLQNPAQPFLSIEEPEANIHPGALAVLASVLDEASLRSQILVTTHSPDMLDHLPAESFMVVEKVGDTTHVGPLDASQLASVRKRLFTPGELLRMEGLQRQTGPEEAAS